MFELFILYWRKICCE